METQKVEKIKEQLEDILAKVAETKNIKNFETTLDLEANYGDGFLGEFFKGQVRNQNTGEVIKVAIKKAPTQGFLIEEVYSNENLFYQKVYPLLDSLQKDRGILEPFDNVPTYFCGSIDPKQEYLAMEDLKSLGYVMFDKKQYFNEEHLNKLFKIYGKFHATSYFMRKSDLERFDNITKLFINLYPKLTKSFEKPIVSAISAAVKALDCEKDKIIYEELKDFGENAVETFFKASKYNGKFRCLIHGDCWSNNMLFKYSESGELLDIKLIDFQLCQDSSPIHDLSYFFYSGACKEDFNNLDNYLQEYHRSFFEHAQQLGANADEIISFEELRNEWKENALLGIFLGIYLWQTKLLPKEDLVNAMTGDDKNQEKPQSMEDSIEQFRILQETVHNNEAYKIRTSNILRHAYECGIINRKKIIRN